MSAASTSVCCLSLGEARASASRCEWVFIRVLFLRMGAPVVLEFRSAAEPTPTGRALVVVMMDRFSHSFCPSLFLSSRSPCWCVYPRPSQRPGNYVMYRRSGNTLYMSGHLPKAPDGTLTTGKVRLHTQERPTTDHFLRYFMLGLMKTTLAFDSRGTFAQLRVAPCVSRRPRWGAMTLKVCIDQSFKSFLGFWSCC